MKKLIILSMLLAIVALLLVAGCGTENKDPRALHTEDEVCNVDNDCINWEYGEKCIDGFCVEREDLEG